MCVRLCIVCLIGLLLSGCATLSERECLSADWYELGQRDGYDGYPLARLGDHRSACLEYGVTPDASAWTSGHEQGLLRYCTPQRGFEVGRAGWSYRQVCPLIPEADFMRGFLLGQDIYRDRQRLDWLAYEIVELERRLAVTDEAAERVSLRRRIRLLDLEMSALRHSLLRQEERALDQGYR